MVSYALIKFFNLYNFKQFICEIIITYFSTIILFNVAASNNL